MLKIRLLIREVANEKGITSALQLAHLVPGLAFAKANALYQGRVSSSTSDGRSVGILLLARIADALEVSVCELFEEYRED